MPVCTTKFHGSITFDPEQVLHVPQGLFGFPTETEFLLLELPSARPMAFLQSVHTQDLCFLTLPVQVIDPEYRLLLYPHDAEAFGYPATALPVMGKQLLCLAILTIREGDTPTANLRAPLVVDIARHRGIQAIVQGSYSHQHPLTGQEFPHRAY
jgi:flagellar assembly factor FliW